MTVQGQPSNHSKLEVSYYTLYHVQIFHFISFLILFQHGIKRTCLSQWLLFCKFVHTRNNLQIKIYLYFLQSVFRNLGLTMAFLFPDSDPVWKMLAGHTRNVHKIPSKTRQPETRKCHVVEPMVGEKGPISHTSSRLDQYLPSDHFPNAHKNASARTWNDLLSSKIVISSLSHCQSNWGSDSFEYPWLFPWAFRGPNCMIFHDLDLFTC